MTQKLTQKPIAIAADHGGYELKEHLVKWLKAEGYAVTDCGTTSASERVDAMDYALKLVGEIKQGRSDFVIAICRNGQTMAITANRFPFMRAVVLTKPADIAIARGHADANMLSLGADNTSPIMAQNIAQQFLSTPALGGRYAVRREKLAALKTEEI